MKAFTLTKAFLLALFLSFAAVAQGAQNSIQAIDVMDRGDSVVVRLSMKEPLQAAPASFSVVSPPRVAFDFPNTASALPKNSDEVNQGDLRSYTVVQAGDRTRVVLNLNAPMVHKAEVDGNALIINLTRSGQPAAAPKAARFAESSNVGARHAVRAIDFRRGPGGEGRIVVDLSDPDTGIDIRTQGNTLVVDFIRTSLPEHLRKRLDVADFGTPVTNIKAFAQGENARVVIEPTGLWEHNAYQTDNQFVVEVKPVQYDPNKLVQGTRGGYKGEKLSLNFQNVEVRSVLNVIADFTDLNIITSDSVQGNLTLRLKDVPWDQALDIILQTRGLAMRKNGNVVWIAPADELATKEKLEHEARQQIEELEPLRTETFHLNYIKAADLAKILTDEKQRILSKRGSAVWDQRTNVAFIQDIPSRLEEVRKIIAVTDVPVKQVMIEARIVEADDRFARTLGARLGYNSTINGSSALLGNESTRVTFGGALEGPAYLTGQLEDQPAFENVLGVNLPANIPGGPAPGRFSMVLFSSSLSRFLNLELSALESDGKGKIISSPRVVTANQVEAVIEQGTEIPYQEASSSGATSVQFKKAVLALRVTPHITPDGNVMMEVSVNKDAVSQFTGAAGAPAIDTKHVKTSVLVENGGTVVIGGIYTQEERNQVNKIPLLGDIPGLGNLFRNTLRQDNKTELLVFLTPRIVEDKLTVR